MAPVAAAALLPPPPLKDGESGEDEVPLASGLWVGVNGSAAAFAAASAAFAAAKTFRTWPKSMSSLLGK